MTFFFKKKTKNHISFKFYLHLGRTMMRLSYCVGLAYIKGIVHPNLLLTTMTTEALVTLCNPHNSWEFLWGAENSSRCLYSGMYSNIKTTRQTCPYCSWCVILVSIRPAVSTQIGPLILLDIRMTPHNQYGDDAFFSLCFGQKKKKMQILTLTTSRRWFFSGYKCLGLVFLARSLCFLPRGVCTASRLEFGLQLDQQRFKQIKKNN